jgi:hypothetical protein
MKIIGPIIKSNYDIVINDKNKTTLESIINIEKNNAPVYNLINPVYIQYNTNYKNGKCDLSNGIIKSFIRISNFNISNPTCEEGPLFNSDEKIIPDDSFTLIVSYPLSFNFEVVINNDLSVPGFTLKELIHSIQALYKFIYEEEERTATQQIYRFSRKCSECTNKNIS